MLLLSIGDDKQGWNSFFKLLQTTSCRRFYYMLILTIYSLFSFVRVLAADEKRKHDARIAQLEEEIEEERTQNELLMEKFKRANMQAR